MSQSKETRAQSKAEREEKRRQEERSNRRTAALYTVVGVVVVVAAVILLVWNSGILQRTLTAVEVDGVKYTAADVEFYYNSTYNQIVNTYMEQYYTAPFDTSVSTKKQVYDEETGQTWHDYLLGSALDNLTHDTALAKQARPRATPCPPRPRRLDSTLAQLDAGWIGYGYANRDAFIRANYGSHMTYNRLVELFQTQAWPGTGPRPSWTPWSTPTRSTRPTMRRTPTCWTPTPCPCSCSRPGWRPPTRTATPSR